MAEQISINVSYATQVYGELQKEIQAIREQLEALDKKVISLDGERGGEGEWKGDSAKRFFSEYDSMQNKITQEFPTLLDELNDNMNKNLGNLVSADGHNA